ncbi:MAG: ATP-binding protein [Gammaproteobacteria bacterium]|nr:ATP-binding protein [Gammaproteobacteria bacterium]
MRSLFLKFFLSFWLVIGLILGAAAATGFLYAERLQATVEDFEAGNSKQQASAALERGGRDELQKWRDGTPRNDGVAIFLIDQTGRDISGRDVPFAVERMFERHRARLERSRNSGDVLQDLRGSQNLPQLTAPDGEIFTMLVAPVRAPEAFWSNQDARVLLLVFGLLTSGLVSYGLASAFSRPVHKLRDATVALAEGDLGARVAGSVASRRDELGMLGREFDSMAEQLERAARRQTELSRNISHELRSPLARMRVAVEMARRKAGDLAEFGRLEQETERLDALIGQILSYTKLESDLERSAERVDIVDVVSEVAENVNFEAKGDRVRVDADGAAEVAGFRGALVGAVENVVRNAVRHNPPDGEVSVRVASANGGVSITIEDSGPGVAESDLSKLFDPFFRTRDSAERDGNGGTGLGLAIAKRAVVDLHGGDIRAKNRASGGLSVTMLLPA